MVILITGEMASTFSCRQLFLIAIGHMVPPPTIGTASMTKDIRLIIDGKDITGTARTL